MASKRSQSCRIGLAIFFMVSSAFIGLGSASGDNSDRLAPYGICDIEQASFRHADGSIPELAVGLALIKPVHGKWVSEHVTRSLERNAVIGIVLDGLGVVPLKCAIVHKN